MAKGKFQWFMGSINGTIGYGRNGCENVGSIGECHLLKETYSNGPWVHRCTISARGKGHVYFVYC